MNFYFTPRRAHLKVFSAICANFVVVWLATVFTTTDILVLTRNIVAAIIALYAAIAAEEALEKNEY